MGVRPVCLRLEVLDPNYIIEFLEKIFHMVRRLGDQFKIIPYYQLVDLIIWEQLSEGEATKCEPAKCVVQTR